MRGDGRVYRPVRDGRELPFWHLAYWANGREVRESSRTTDKEEALRLLRSRVAAVRAIRPVFDDNPAKRIGSRSGIRGIYFLQSKPGGPIKIGWAANVYKRMAALQIATPERLRMLGVTLGAGKWEERRLHRFFADSRVRGEWFKQTPDLMRWISVNTSPPEGGRQFFHEDASGDPPSLASARRMDRLRAEEDETVQ